MSVVEQVAGPSHHQILNWPSEGKEHRLRLDVSP